MNARQRILTYVCGAIVLLAFCFVPWRDQNGPTVGYLISPYWRPVSYDEGGALPLDLLGLLVLQPLAGNPESAKDNRSPAMNQESGT